MCVGGHPQCIARQVKHCRQRSQARIAERIDTFSLEVCPQGKCLGMSEYIMGYAGGGPSRLEMNVSAGFQLAPGS